MNISARILVLLLACMALVSMSPISMPLTTGPGALPAAPKGIRIYQVDNLSATDSDFSLQQLDGETVSLSDYRGRWVMLHFWASWCGPCRLEMPQIQQLATTFSKDELAIIMVNTAEDEDTVFSFMAEVGLETGSLLDRDGRVTEAWKPRGLPTSFLIDPAGQVQFQAIGGREWSKPVYVNFLRQLTGQK